MKIKILVAAAMVAWLTGCNQQKVTPSAGASPDADYAVKEIDYLGPELTLDGIYPSMQGPAATDMVALKPNSSELGWITGFRSVMVNKEGTGPASQEYMCHTNLDILALDQHLQDRGVERFNPGRMFTISQGQQEVDLPKGFGLPIRMGQPMAAAVQVLNLNHEVSDPFTLRHKLTFRYIENSEVKGTMTPLFTKSGVVLKALDKNSKYYGTEHQDTMTEGACLIGNPAVGKDVFADENGNPFTAHWVVEKGVEENRTLVKKMLDLPYDTTIHYILAHVHPFCQSLELRDLTTGKSVVKLEMKQTDGMIGLSHTEHFESIEGVPLYKDHDYEMISVYNNTSDEVQDAMAVMIFFLKDKTFNADEYLAKVGQK